MRINLSRSSTFDWGQGCSVISAKIILTEVYNDHKKEAHNAKEIRLANSSFRLSGALKLSQLLNFLLNFHAWKLKNLTSLTQWHKDIVLTNCSPKRKQIRSSYKTSQWNCKLFEGANRCSTAIVTCYVCTDCPAAFHSCRVTHKQS